MFVTFLVYESAFCKDKFAKINLTKKKHNKVRADILNELQFIAI